MEYSRAKQREETLEAGCQELCKIQSLEMGTAQLVQGSSGNQEALSYIPRSTHTGFMVQGCNPNFGGWVEPKNAESPYTRGSQPLTHFFTLWRYQPQNYFILLHNCNFAIVMNRMLKKKSVFSNGLG